MADVNNNNDDSSNHKNNCNNLIDGVELTKGQTTEIFHQNISRTFEVDNIGPDSSQLSSENTSRVITAVQVDTVKSSQLEKCRGRRAVCWGRGEFGQHGHGVIDDVSFREGEITLPSLQGRVKLAACGSSHTLVVTDEDTIYTWGNGSSGQLGEGSLSSHNTPTQVILEPPPPDDVTVVSVDCGSRHSMVVLSNGHLYSFGNNFFAQLGYDFKKENYKENQSTPCLVRLYNPVKAVACGDKHSLILFSDGTVSAVGNNGHGQLGDGTRAECQVPKTLDLEGPVRHIGSGSNHSLAISDSGDVYVWGYCRGCGHRQHDVLSPELKLQDKHAVQVVAGGTHCMALTDSGIVYTWGFGTEGQLGHGETITALATPRPLRHKALRHRVSHISAAESFSAAVTVDGYLYMWGKHSHVITARDSTSKYLYHPTCLTEDSGDCPGVHSMVCGAWHAVALRGMPEFQPRAPELEEMIDDEEEEMNNDDAFSTTSSLSGQLAQDVTEDVFGHMETVEPSVPPTAHNDSPENTMSPKRTTLPGIPMRGQTKLTLGEFYSMSDSSSVSSHNTTKDALSPRPRTESELSVNKLDQDIHGHSPRSPSDTVDDTEAQSDCQEQTDSHQAQESPTKSDSSSSSSPSSMVSESSLKKRMAENTKSINGGVQFKSNREFTFRRKPPPSRPAMSMHVVTNPGRESTKPPTGKLPSPGDRAHTMFISKTPASHFSLPRERSFVSKQSMALMDYQELCNGSIFNNQDTDVIGHVTPQHGSSACSSRMELLIPAADLELQEILGHKTPEKLPMSPMNNRQPSASDTPSTLARQMRTREMIGSGGPSVTYTPTLATPSPVSGVFYKDMLNNNSTVSFTRSKTLLGSLGRGTPKFYRKPGLPCAKAPPMKGSARQMAFATNSFQTALGEKSHSTDSDFANMDTDCPPLELSSQHPSSPGCTPRTFTKRPTNHFLRSGFSTPPAPSNKHHESTSPFGRLRGIHSQPEPISNNGACPLCIGSLLDDGDVTKRKAVYSSATSWRKRSNTVLGTKSFPAGKTPSPSLKQNTALNGIGTRLNSDIHLNNSSGFGVNLSPDTDLNGIAYQKPSTNAGAKRNISLTPTRISKNNAKSKTKS